MALQFGALRQALVAGGTPADLADKASEELAGYENKLAEITTRLAVLRIMVSGLYALIVTLVVPADYLLVRIAIKTGSLG